MPVSAIDFTAVTSVIHAFITPNPDGTISGITVDQSAELVDAAHAAGRTAIVSVGGENSEPAFKVVLSPGLRPIFERNLLNFISARNYDGIDLDMEPMQPGDAQNYTDFVTELRAQMSARRPGLLLTAAAESSQADLFAQLQSDFDQINVMTYCLAGPWPGFSTWYNSSLFGGGARTMPGGAPFPSGDAVLASFEQAGVVRNKLGLGIAFFGTIWHGATAPFQSIQGTTMEQISFQSVMDRYFEPELFHYDSVAKAAYLTIQTPRQEFIDYENETVCTAKVGYAKQIGLGGVMIWELSSGYLPAKPDGLRNPLLLAVKQAWIGHN